MGSFSMEGIDAVSLELIIELQQEDIQTLRANFKGKQQAGTTSDSEIALGNLEEHLQAQSMILSDRRMTQSIAEAVLHDGTLLSQSQAEEEMASRDRSLAHRLNGNSRRAQPESVPSKVDTDDSEQVDGSTLSRLASLYVSEPLGEELWHQYQEASASTQAGSSTAKIYRRAKESSNHRCEACGDTKPFYEIISGPCGHEYCRECIIALFESCMSDESLFPPRCCRQVIPVAIAAVFMSRDLRERFAEKAIEYNTENRVYCSNGSCSKFIQPDNIRDAAAICSSCRAQTCIHCKTASHPGDCEHDPALAQLLTLANAEGWQRCFRCGRIVDLDVGCNHMT